MSDDIESTRPRQRIAPFECALCGFESSFSGQCPHCDVSLHDQREALPWQLQARKAMVFGETPLAALLYLAFVFGSLAAFLLVAKFGAYAIAAIPLLAALFWAQRRLDPERERIRVARRLHERESSRATLSNTTNGARVQCSGVPIVRAHALAEPGLDLIACEHLQRALYNSHDESLAGVMGESRTRPTRTQTGAEFSLQTSEGVTVRVKLDHFVLLNGERITHSGRSIITGISAGTPVRVSGLARWVDDPDAAGMRSNGRMLELEGTPENPIVIEPVALSEWIDEQGPKESHTSESVAKSGENPQSTEVRASSTGVRVSVDTESVERESKEGVLRSEPRTEEARTGVQKR